MKMSGRLKHLYAEDVFGQTYRIYKIILTSLPDL